MPHFYMVFTFDFRYKAVSIVQRRFARTAFCKVYCCFYKPNDSLWLKSLVWNHSNAADQVPPDSSLEDPAVPPTLRRQKYFSWPLPLIDGVTTSNWPRNIAMQIKMFYAVFTFVLYEYGICFPHYLQGAHSLRF